MISQRGPAANKKAEQNRKALRNVALAALLISPVAYLYVQAMLSHQALDPITLCPTSPAGITVLLVDVTDPMNVPQRQDFINQLDRLRSSIPRYGKLVVYKVDPISDRLLTPVITRCNPGTAKDVSEFNGNPQQTQQQWEEGFKNPLDGAFHELLNASGAKRSPILESIQSAALTEFQTTASDGKPRRLVVASDLLQNTDTITFYRVLPEPTQLTTSQAFSRVRTDLRGVDVELWMLQRGDSRVTQPRSLPDLWDQIISKQGGNLIRTYTVSG